MKPLYSILITLLLSSSCFAADTTTKTAFNKTHTLGIGVGLYSGTMDNDYDSGELYEEDNTISTALFYQFHIDGNWAVAIGYHQTSAGFCFVCGPLTDDSGVRYSNVTTVDNIYVTAQYTYPIAPRWAIYTNLGFNRYDVDFTEDRYNDIVYPSRDDIGVDLAAGLGIKFQAFNGFGIGWDFKYLGADKVQTKIGTLTFSYSF